MYPWKLPREGDYVKCQITEINMKRAIVQVSFPEYPECTGYVVFAKMIRGRMRSKSKLGKVGNSFIGYVISLVPHTKIVELSKTVVTPEITKEVSYAFSIVKRFDDLMGNVASKCNMSTTELAEQTMWPYYSQFYEETYGIDPQDVVYENPNEFDPYGGDAIIYGNESQGDQSDQVDQPDTFEERPEGMEDEEEEEDEIEDHDVVITRIGNFGRQLLDGDLDFDNQFSDIIQRTDEPSLLFVKRLRQMVKNLEYVLEWNLKITTYDSNGITLLNQLLGELNTFLLALKSCKSISLIIISPPDYRIKIDTKENEDITKTVNDFLADTLLPRYPSVAVTTTSFNEKEI